MKNPLTEIIHEVGKASNEGSGLSYCELFKILRDHYKFEGNESNIRYHLEKLRKAGLLVKNGSKYLLESDVVAMDGVVLFANPPAILNCPFYTKCSHTQSGKCFNPECDLFQVLPETFREYYAKVYESPQR